MNPSYAYVYDEFLSDRRYERDLATLDNALHTFDLAGRVARLSLFRKAKDVIVDMVNQGVTTVVLVGDDAMLVRMMAFLPDLDITLGYIPMGKTSLIGDLLRIPHAAEACDTLSARLVETLDVGRVNSDYFLIEARADSVPASLRVDGCYVASFSQGGIFSVRNLGGLEGRALTMANAQDGMLEAHLTPYAARGFSLWRHTELPTRIFLTDGVLEAENDINVAVDDQIVRAKRFAFSTVPKGLKIITGRTRRLARGTSTSAGHDAPAAGLRKSGKIGTFRPTSDRRGR